MGGAALGDRTNNTAAMVRDSDNFPDHDGSFSVLLSALLGPCVTIVATCRPVASSEWLTLERWLPLSVILLAVVAVPLMVFAPSGLTRLSHLKAERARTEEQISQLSQEILELRAQIDRIKQDPTAVEQVARDELGLVRQTELVVQFNTE